MDTLASHFSTRRPEWIGETLRAIARDGYAIVADVVPAQHLSRIRAAMYEVRERIHADIGVERLERVGELDVLRLMLRYDESFVELLELDPMLAIVDRLLSPAAVLHQQNGLIETSFPGCRPRQPFQTSFRQDFPQHLRGYVASVNALLAIDEFTNDNGAPLLVPGSQQCPLPPDPRVMESMAGAARCPPGSMIVFDSTLWHAAGVNASGTDRLAVDQQFTRSFVRPQIDYGRALGDRIVLRQRPRTQQLLGWNTRVAASLDEHYRYVDE